MQGDLQTIYKIAKLTAKKTVKFSFKQIINTFMKEESAHFVSSNAFTQGVSQPVIVCSKQETHEDDQQCQYGVVFDGKVVWNKMQDNIIDALNMWVAIHYVFHVKADEKLENLLEFFAVHVYKIKSPSIELTVSNLITRINSLK